MTLNVDDGLGAGAQIVVEGPRSYHLANPLVEMVPEDREVAWASPLVSARRDFGWVLGRFVEADNANENGHIFALEELRRAHASIVSTPLNMLHRAHHVVGTFTAARLVEPTAGLGPLSEPNRLGVAAAGGTLVDQSSWSIRSQGRLLDRSDGMVANPHVEALAAFWRWVFPEEYAAVQAAYAAGSLFFSMEAVPESLTCPTCESSFRFAGPRSESYCDHLRAGPRAPKVLNNPHFVGGAMIIPPTQPGWRKADVTELAALVEAHSERAGELYDEVAAVSPQLGPSEWEGLMAELLVAECGGDVPLRARTAAVAARLADLHRDAALPDGSAVIEDEDDLAAALANFTPKRGALKRHIIARARRLRLLDHLPPTWRETTAAVEAEVPESVLEAYTAHLSNEGYELGDAPAGTVAAIDDGRRLWQLADGWGEWYFAEHADLVVVWVATKMGDVGAFSVADQLQLDRREAGELGWSDQAWMEHLATKLART